MRLATLADYDWLYNHEVYGENPLEHAAEAIPHILRLKEQGASSILDIGGGRGHFAELMQRSGFRAAYAEPRHRPQSRHGAHRFYECSLPEIPSRYYDILTCFDVLEHLPLEEALASIDALKDAAQRALLATIYTESDTRRVAGELVEMHLTQRHQTWWLEQFTGSAWTCSLHATANPARWLIQAVRR